MVDPAKAALRDEVVARLDGLPGLRSKGMFGGYGLWADENLFFGVVDDGRVFFRTDERNRAAYAGQPGFDYSGGAEPPSETYLAVPLDVYDDPARLLAYAEDAVDVARAAKRRTGTRPRPAK